MIPMNLTRLSETLQQKFQKRNQPLKKFYAKSQFTIFNESYSDYKLHVNKAQGCFIEDMKGHRYIDTTLGAGTHILGYTPPFLPKVLNEQSKKGTLYILANMHTYELAGLLQKILPHFGGFVFCSTGSEATMRAARIARAYTRKKKIAVFSGGWHGGTDFMLIDDDYKSKDRPNPVFKSSGLPKEILDCMLMLPYNDPRAFEMIEKNKDDLAMVIIEPAQGSNPREDVGDFLKKLRAVTLKHNIVLCFDEMITGFRVSLGGCQEFYGIKADMATYGKALGGGLPIGVVAGRKDIMNVIKGGAGQQPVFMGGTFSSNPLVMCAVKTLVEYLIKNKDTVYPYLNRQGQLLRQGINGFCVEHKIPVRAIGIGSMTRPLFTDHMVTSRWEREQHECSQDLQNLFYLYVLLNYNVHVNAGRVIYLSTAHKKDHMGQIIKSLQESLYYFSKELKAF